MLTQRSRAAGAGLGEAVERLTPYRQGQLDALCGAYAVINACRWCLRHDVSAGKGTVWEELFGEIVLSQAHASGASMVMLGAGQRDLRNLLKVAAGYLATVHKVAIEWYQPFGNRSPRAVVEVIELVQDHLRGAQAGCIVCTSGTYDHWTVITGIEGKRLRLFDSSTWNVLPVSSLGAERANPSIRLSSMFMLSVR